MTYVCMHMGHRCSMPVLLCDKHFQKQGVVDRVYAHDICMYAYVGIGAI
jgi:hypothetical protein